MNKKSKTFLFLGQFFLFCCGLLIFTDFAYTNLRKKGLCYKIYRKTRNYIELKSGYRSLKAAEPLKPEETSQWYASKPFIAHACGGIDGIPYTNSYDALTANYNKGHRVFEADISLTNDGHAVLVHDWEDFLSTANIHGGGIVFRLINFYMQSSTINISRSALKNS